MWEVSLSLFGECPCLCGEFLLVYVGSFSCMPQASLCGKFLLVYVRNFS